MKNLKFNPFFLLFICINISTLKAQMTFQKLYDGKGIIGRLVETPDNGYVSIFRSPYFSPQTSESINALDVGVIKLDSNFQVEWIRSFFSDIKKKEFVDVASIGDFYFAIGYIEINGSTPIITKLNKDGEEIWTKKVTDTYRLRALEVIDNELWILANQSQGEQNPGVFILNESGELIKNTFYLTDKDAQFRGVKKYQNEYYVIGTTEESDDFNILLGKLSEDKELVWLKEYQGATNDGPVFEGILKPEIVNEELVLIHEVLDTAIDSDSPEKVRLFKFDLEGELSRVKELRVSNGPLSGSNFYINNNTFFLGLRTWFNGLVNPCFVSLNSDLEILKSRRYDPTGLQFNNVLSIHLLPDGLLFSGNQYRWVNNYQGFYLIKTTFDGNSACPNFKLELIEKEVLDEYKTVDIFFFPTNNGDLGEQYLWDSTYTLESKVVYQCEENFLTLYDPSEKRHCHGDKVRLNVFGREGAIEWNIPEEQIIEKTDNHLTFKLLDNVEVVARDLVSGDSYATNVILNCDETLEEIELIVNQAFSPNEDGLNDYFTIQNISRFPANTVRIIDQKGNTVFYKIGYTNDWTDPELVNGVYYYIIQKEDSDDRPLTGTILVNH